MSALSVRPAAVSPAALPLPRLLRAVSPGRDDREALVSIAEAAAVALEAAGRLGLARTPDVGADDPWSEAGRNVAIERLAAEKDQPVDRLISRLGPTWRGVADADYRRRLGQSLARL